MKLSLPRSLLCGMVAALAASCSPSADIRLDDLRTYTVPRRADMPASAKAAAVSPASAQAAAAGGPALTYDLPEGWTDLGAGGMRLATLKTGPKDGSDIGEITIIPASGTLEGNAARWQEQLTPGGGRELLARAIEEAETVPVNGADATVLLLSDDATENRQAILAAMIPLDASTSLFVKFKGSAELAGRLRDPFTTFVRSIRWK